MKRDYSSAPYKRLERFFKQRVADQFGINLEEVDQFMQQHPLPPDSLRIAAKKQQTKLNEYWEKFDGYLELVA